MLERRCRQEPLAYIVGRKEFWSLDFRVTKDTLIPRSDSEVIIETLAVSLCYICSATLPLRLVSWCSYLLCVVLGPLSVGFAVENLGCWHRVRLSTARCAVRVPACYRSGY